MGDQLWQSSGLPEEANQQLLLLFIKSSLLYNKHDIHSPWLVVVPLTVQGFHSSLSGHPFSTAAKNGAPTAGNYLQTQSPQLHQF